MYEFNYEDPYEQQMAQLQGLTQPYQANTDFGRVSMGQAPQSQEVAQNQADTANVMNEANFDAAGDVGQAARDMSVYEYTSEGADDTQALGEGMFAFGLSMLMNASQPGANFGSALAAGVSEGSKAFGGALNRNKRFENREALEKKGFTQESIDAYIKTGDNKALVKGEGGKSEWTAPNSDGYMTNKFTGEVKQAYSKGGDADWSSPTAAGWSINSKTGETKQVHAPTGRGGSGGGGSGSGGSGSSGKPKWTTELYEYRNKDGVRQLKEYTYDSNAHPSERQYFEGANAVPSLPEGGRFRSEAQQRLDANNEAASDKETSKLANLTGASAENAGLMMSNTVGLLDPTQLWPYGESGKKAATFDLAAASLSVQKYSSMTGVAGASVKTEEQLIKEQPTRTSDPEVVARWVNKRLNYDRTVLEATIRQQESRWGYASPELKRNLEAVNNQIGNVRITLEAYTEKGNGSSAPKPVSRSEVRAQVKANNSKPVEQADHSDLWN
ncbi:MAG: hypothetical protein ACRCZ2_08750 [Fusobacteriaceae bacterium]